MKYRRALFLADPAKPPGPAFSVLGRVAPALERLLVVEQLPEPISAWLLGERSPEREERASASLRTLGEAAAGLAPSIDLKFAPELRPEALAALCAAEDIDLLVLGSRSLKSALIGLVQRRRPPVAMLWAEGAGRPGPIEHVACVTLDQHSRAAIATFLRDRVEASARVTVLSLTGIASDVLASMHRVGSIEASVEVSSLREAASMRQWLDEWTRQRPIDLLVFSRIPNALVRSAFPRAPVLVLPPAPVRRQLAERRLDVADAIDLGGAIRLRIDQVAPVGGVTPVTDQLLTIISGERVVARVEAAGGELELARDVAAGALSMCRARTDPSAERSAVAEPFSIVRPGAQPLVLFDAELPDGVLEALAGWLTAHGPELLAVRLRPTRNCRAIRQRLLGLGLRPRVIDARAVLDEGEALDVSVSLDGVRLARVAARLARAGFAVAAIAPAERGPTQPAADGFIVLTGRSLASTETYKADSDASRALAGNRIDIEIDNATARRWLLEAIEQSEKTLHLQVYMALDDEIGVAVEAALARAGARGVKVRVLVDSLHGLHGSFGTHNALLERLSTYNGVELRTSRPITELPSLADLKQRDHRKLVVADGWLGLLGGRNLSHEYYTAFYEAELTADSLWREVPWLDAGARVEGPAVAALEASFLDAWREAGGAAFHVHAPPPVGSSAARVVVHRGLRDARTLEAYLELIESATSHLYVVNGFPLLLELQHALLRALSRGVRVRALTGHLTPTYAGHLFGGAWATARTAATELVHSRMDPIVAAGGEVYLFAQRDLPRWAPELGVVHPHVHAKALSVDGRRCAVGSANMDITAAYWESELLLVVEDPALASTFEAQVSGLMSGSIRIRRDDPAWQQLARRRAWMRHWPGVLSV